MKYPKLRDGPNAVGEALHRHLQRSDAPFLSAESFDAGANKMGNGAEVYGGVTDGFYSLGSLETDPADAPYKIVASNNARGAFLNRGPWKGGAFSIPILFYVGAGAAVVPAEDGSISPVSIESTKNGKTFKPVVTFSFSTAAFAQFVWRIHASAFADNSGVMAWTWAISYWRLTEAAGVRTATAVYFYTLDSGKTFTAKSISLGPRTLIGMPFSSRIGPRNALVFIPFDVVGEGALPINEHWDPQPDARASLCLKIIDNGLSQEVLDGGDLLSMLELSSQEVITDPIEASIVNALMEQWCSSLQTVPLADESVLVLGYAEFYDGRYSGGGIVDTGVYTFRFNGTSFSFVGKIAIPGIDTFTVNLMLLDDKPVGIVRAQDADEVTRFIIGNESGTSWEYKVMPHTRRNTGNMSAIDKKTLICPMYDSESQSYVLMQTKDLGDTWTKRATIAKNVPAPSPTDQTLQRFSSIAYLRKDDFPAKSFPGAPWIGDDRITPPWEA